jgi:predicted enzyme related to lactoylglutathione lyase
MAECNPVRWFEIYVQDMDRARRFYEAVLNVRLERMPAGDLEMCAFPGDRSLHGTRGALVHMTGVRSGGNSTLVYFACDDCAIEAGRIPAAGGTVHREKMSIGEYGHIVLAIDPDGNMIGLHSMQ